MGKTSSSTSTSMMCTLNDVNGENTLRYDVDDDDDDDDVLI